MKDMWSLELNAARDGEARTVNEERQADVGHGVADKDEKLIKIDDGLVYNRLSWRFHYCVNGLAARQHLLSLTASNRCISKELR
jgi:hypothetical protein